MSQTDKENHVCKSVWMLYALLDACMRVHAYMHALIRAHSICNYAALKHVVRKDLASAELLYRMGLEENPEHVGILYNYRSHSFVAHALICPCVRHPAEPVIP